MRVRRDESTYAACQSHDNIPIRIESDLKLANETLDFHTAVKIGFCVRQLDLLESGLHDGNNLPKDDECRIVGNCKDAIGFAH